MIQLKDVCKFYQVGDDKVRALDHASLHIKPQEFVSIIGPSGSGKSTLMNIIGCLDVADLPMTCAIMVADYRCTSYRIADKYRQKGKIHIHEYAISRHPILTGILDQLDIVEHTHYGHGNIGHKLR